MLLRWLDLDCGDFGKTVVANSRILMHQSLGEGCVILGVGGGFLSSG